MNDKAGKGRTDSSLDVREMELEDLPAVFALGERLFTADQWPNLYRTWDEYELIGLFSEDGEFCLVAEDEEEGRVVGFALGSLISKRKSAWSYGYVQWIGVDPDHTRRGIARRLLNRLTELFIEDGARMMLVDTDAENDDAIGFFKGEGFGNEVQHVYMSKNLTQLPGYRRRRAKGGTRNGSSNR